MLHTLLSQLRYEMPVLPQARSQNRPQRAQERHFQVTLDQTQGSRGPSSATEDQKQRQEGRSD